MAAVTLSPSLKIADPATSTSAPAATASGAVVASTPPSTSRPHPGLMRSIISRTRPLRERRGEKMLMPESRVHGHDQYLVEVLHDFFGHRGGRGRVDGNADALPQRFDALHGTRQVVVALPVDQK